MKEPTTPEEVKVLHNLLRSDPQHYLQIVDKWIADNPANSHAYFIAILPGWSLVTHNALLMTSTWSIQLNPSLSHSGRVGKSMPIGEYEKPWRILIALSTSIPRNGQRMHSGCWSRPIVTRG